MHATLKILIAPDSFKESLSSVQVADTLHQAFRQMLPAAEYVVIPMADGGTGTLTALGQALAFEKHRVQVTGPLFKLQQAVYASLTQDKTAIIEMAEASGLHSVPTRDRNPLYTTSIGTGELILDALDKGYRKFIVCLGGSATCDGGMGALHALGIQFKDSENQLLKPVGKNLESIASIDVEHLDKRIQEAEFVLAHDVDNPLLGQEGALQYAPQKGAGPEELACLARGFENYAARLATISGKNLGDLAGTGAAGGLSAGLFAFLNARLTPGAALMMELTHLPATLEQVNLVITGEGQFDSQSLHGKTPIAIAQLAAKKRIPVIAFAAHIKGDREALYHQGITAAFSIAPGPIQKNRCIKLAKPLLLQAAHNVARLLQCYTNVGE